MFAGMVGMRAAHMLLLHHRPLPRPRPKGGGPPGQPGGGPPCPGPCHPPGVGMPPRPYGGRGPAGEKIGGGMRWRPGRGWKAARALGPGGSTTRAGPVGERDRLRRRLRSRSAERSRCLRQRERREGEVQGWSKRSAALLRLTASRMRENCSTRRQEE